MTEKPLVSVIVPIYGVEKYLDECIISIINQTYDNLEIILVDDGSPDNCPKIADQRAIKDKRIIVIHKKNGGLSSARNAGLEISNGEFVAFIDGDDWIESTYIERLVFATTNYKAGIGVIGFYRTFEVFSSQAAADKKGYVGKTFVLNVPIIQGDTVIT